MNSCLDNIEEFPKKVYNIFCDFFGESLVDIYGEEDEEDEDEPFVYYCILVRFPRVIIKNEYDEQRILKELYVKINVNPDGTIIGTFGIARSSFTIDELAANYIHSHVPPLTRDSITEFSNCCLGNGPIASTCALLSTGYSEDYWRLFCLELSKYVTVESINGGPYVRMSRIGASSNKVTLDTIFIRYENGNERVIIDNFLPYYMRENNLKFCYNRGIYSLGISCLDYLLDVSNAFIKWANVNKALATTFNAASHLEECYINNGMLYTNNSTREELYSGYSEYNNLPMFYFKGDLIHTTITDLEEDNKGTHLKTLKWNIASIILYKILILVNCIYGNSRKETDTDKVLFQI